MAMRKCPRCELNYIREDERYCNVCMRELKRAQSRSRHGDEEPDEDEVVLCAECGESPAVHGNDLCMACLKEQKRQVELENAADLDAVYDEAVSSDEIEEEEEEG